MAARQNIVWHLVNVLAIGGADGSFKPAEEIVFQNVVNRLIATPEEVTMARAVVKRDPGIKLQFFNDSGASMAVIEDMVMIAMADGRLDPKESQPLEAYFGNLGYAQADIDMIVRRVRARLNKLGLPPVAPVKNTSTASAPSTPSKPVAPTPKAAVRSEPVEQQPARPAPKTAPAPAEKPPVAKTEEPKKVVENPKPPVAKKMTWEQCSQIRAGADCGACYCFGATDESLNPWGCRLIDMAWSENADWLRIGSFRDDETFVFDRKAIGEQIAKRLESVAVCPYQIKGFSNMAVELLPSKATLNGRWRLHVVKSNAKGAVQVTANTYMHGCRRQTQLTVDGMAPLNDFDARLIIRRAARRAGVKMDLEWLDKKEKGVEA